MLSWGPRKEQTQHLDNVQIIDKMKKIGRYVFSSVASLIMAWHLIWPFHEKTAHTGSKQTNVFLLNLGISSIRCETQQATFRFSLMPLNRFSITIASRAMQSTHPTNKQMPHFLFNRAYPRSHILIISRVGAWRWILSGTNVNQDSISAKTKRIKMIFTSLQFSALAGVNLVLWPAWQLCRSVSTRSEDSEAVELVRMEVEELVTELDWSGSVWRHSGCHGTAPLTEARTSWLHRSEAELRKGGTWDHHRPHHQPHPHRPHCHPQHFPHCHHHWQLWLPLYADSVAVASSRMQYIVEIQFALN